MIIKQISVFNIGFSLMFRFRRGMESIIFSIMCKIIHTLKINYFEIITPKDSYSDTYRLLIEC